MDNLTPITREEILMNDEPLTPITREEKILAGEDLNPVTRREYFLKKYRHAGGDVMVEGLSVTANGTYTAPEGKAYSPVEVNVPMPENAYLLKTASGSLVSFDDGADLPMPSFICDIDAVQDLHGQDAPWVGGAGKNKYSLMIGRDEFTNNISATHSTDSDELQTVTAQINSGVYSSLTSVIRTLVGKLTGTWTYSYEIKASTNVSVYTGYDNLGAKTISVSTNWTRFTATADFTDKTNNAFVVYNKSGIEATITVRNFMIQQGTTATPYEPYSNICPISGHTGVDAVISPTTEASAGTTYSVSWQTEAGEVFGGYVDLVSGELVADRLYFEISNFDSWVYQEFNNFKALYNNLSDLGYPPIKNTRDKKVISDKFKYIYEGAYQPFGVFSIYSNGIIYFWNNDNAYANKNEMITAMNSIKPSVCYELRTPITYQLTPTQIKSLLGKNNAWCSTGDVDIDYFAKEV